LSHYKAFKDSKSVITHITEILIIVIFNPFYIFFFKLGFIKIRKNYR